MLTFKQFTGINNVLPAHRLTHSDLVRAQDVDAGLSGEIERRQGYAEVSTACHKNLWQAEGFMLATEGSHLTAIFPGGARVVLDHGMGPGRVWYCNLPNGRTTYTDGLRHGVTDGTAGLGRSIPAPASLGSPDDTFGALFPGDYRYHLTYVRLTDHLEGPAASSHPVALSQGGLRLDGLPTLAGHALNIYLSGQDGEGAYLAGTTADDWFEFAGNDTQMALPCRTLGATEFPVGTFTAFWRGRVLTAVGATLWASRPVSTHLGDWKDFKQLTAPITAIVPVNDGIYVGTTTGLVFLAGETWDSLQYNDTAHGAVVPGSGIQVPGHQIKLGEGVGRGPAMMCIAGGEIVAGFGDGQTVSLTDGKYKTSAAEVCATFREIRGIPQYIAVPQ